MVRSFRIMIGLLFTLFFSTLSVNAQIKDTTTFADYLFSKKEYYRAITEYYHNIYKATDSVKRIGWMKQVEQCYYDGRDYEEALKYYENNRATFFNSQFEAETKIIYAKSQYQIGNFRASLFSLETIEKESNFSSTKNLICGLSYARLYKMDDATSYFHDINSTYYPEKTINELIACMKNSDKFSLKSKTTASILSAIIPGSGYIYSGRLGTGITSFIINGVLVWALRDVLIHKQYGLTAAISFFGAGWYFGNITGSADAAEEYNNKILNEAIDTTLKDVGLEEYILNK